MDDSAILKQKLEFLEMKLEDSRQREADLQWMYDSMLDSFNISTENMVSDDLKKEREQFEKEQTDIQAKLNAQAKALEAEVRELKDQLQDSDYRLRTQKLTYEEQLMRAKQETFQAQNERTQLEIKLKAIEEDETHSRTVVSLQAKLEAMYRDNEKLHEENEQDLKKAREQTDLAVAELKELYAQDKAELEATVQKLSASLSTQR